MHGICGANDGGFGAADHTTILNLACKIGSFVYGPEPRAETRLYIHYAHPHQPPHAYSGENVSAMVFQWVT